MWTANDIPDQTGKIAIVTGANTGIGFETAKVLYEKGAHVILACRDLDRAQLAMDQIGQKGSAGNMECAQLDLSSLTSIRDFALIFQQKYKELHLLVNNAGVMTPPQSFSDEGYELQFGVNFLGHFALTGYLYKLLQQTTASRIITVTSLAYTYGHIDFENLRSEKSYDAFREYCQSKLANLLFTVELQRKIVAKGDDILSLAAHPGITKTDLGRHMSAEDIRAAIGRFGAPMETAQGALTNLFAAISPHVAKGGLIGPDAGLSGYPVGTPIEEMALDQIVARDLWRIAEQATGLSFP